ncbi:inositol 1,4,5-trisphosphate-gated calcium channel ITPR1-like [Dysidea avara]|uniref:inositol 1,4,5-trisphosphate-gated calcium channel ITPR1-like n=1 Tax=Dysidea avara TaxID=196820 RepID=UPI00331F7164
MALPGKTPNPSLLYGDVVFLHCKSGGYVFSELSSTTRASILVFPVASKDENDPNFPNLKMAAFKILAANQVKAQERFTTLRSTLQGMEEQNLDIEEREALIAAEKNAEVEMHNNDAEQERLRGTLVLYGQTIQLLHLFSGKYVAAKPVETSKTENTNVQVELSRENTEHSFLKILPRYKVKSIGHEVHLHDQVSFEIIKTKGQYLHTSAITYGHIGISLYGHCHEVNVASVPSGYTLKPHYRTILDDEKENYVKAGSVVRLFHREAECYVVAEGSFANKNVMTESVHLRKRKSEHGKLRPPSTSAITYWQIEKDNEPLNGQAVLWEEHCRLRHLPTRLYLAIVKDKDGCFQVTLKERDRSGKSDLDTVFRLTPLIQEDAEIKLESYARINHPLTNQWLSAMNVPFTRQSVDPDATGFGAVQWDTATLKQIVVTKEMNYDDAFTIEEVDHELIEKFNTVAEVIPVIKAYVTELEKDSQRPVSYEEACVVIEALDVIAKFVDSAHVDVIGHQKLLRNLMIIEMMVKILEIYKPNNVSCSTQQMVVKKCYKLLEVYLKGKSGKNEFYVARFIPLFREHIGLDLNVENMLIELLRDNQKIIMEHNMNDVQYIIGLLLRTQEPCFMDFLGVLCVCNDRPITKHQDYIIENLVCNHGKNFFYLTKIESKLSLQSDGEEVIYFCKPDGLTGKNWKPITPPNSRVDSANQHATAIQERQFLVAQLDLFAKLCKGNNKRAIEIIDTKLNYMSFNEALTGAKDTNLDSTLRLKYLELIIVLYVDNNEKNRPVLENLSLSFNYQKVRANPYEEAIKNPHTALTGAVNVHFPALKEWILNHIYSQQNVVGGKAKINNNIFTAHVLRLLHLLIKYGYYANLNDVNRLVPLLLSLLNGASDKPFSNATAEESKEFQQCDRFENTEENEPIFELKIMTLKILNLLFNFRFYLRLQHYIFDYKLLKDEAKSVPPIDQLLQLSNDAFNQNPYGIQDTENSYPLPSNMLAQLKNNPETFSVYKHQELMDLALRRLETIFSFSSYVSETLLPEILLDLANYKSDEILTESLHLLNRYYSSEETLFQKAIQTQLLSNPKSEEVLSELSDELLPNLRCLLNKDVGSEGCEELIKILQRLTSLCYIQNSPHENHSQNQKILYNSGVYTDTLNLVLGEEYQSKRTEITEHSNEHKILSTCLHFLKALARNHKVIQEQLFDCMDDLLELDCATPEVAELLIEVFTGGKEICLRISEKQIDKIFKLIVKSEHSGRPELLEMLQAVVKAEDIGLPLKRNQTLVIKYFNLSRDKFCDEFLGRSPEKEQMRGKLLQAEDSDYNLCVLLRVISLLATCCEGKNLFIESLCQNVISIDEIMKILNDYKLECYHKQPFVSFLLWVYINTGKDLTLTGSKQLSHSKEMWKYLEHVNIMLNGVVQVIMDLPRSEVVPLILSNNPHICRRVKSLTGHKNAKTSQYNVPFVTNQDGELNSNVLIYVLEGIVPLIKGYYTKLFDSDQHTRVVYEIQMSASIASVLLKLADVMTTNNFLTSQEQWRMLSGAIITVISHDCYTEEMIAVDIEIKARFNRCIDSYQSVAVSDTMKQYLEQYEQELTLNEDFNNFVRNFQLAYWGPNKAQHQINSNYDAEYCENVEDFEQKDIEWLPLGPKHQQHTACFVNRQHDETTVLPVTDRIIDYLLISSNTFGSLSESERLAQELNNIKYIQLLRTIVHNEIKHIDPKLREEGSNPQEFRTQSERVQAVQNQIQELGQGSTITRLMKLLLHPNNKISDEVLVLSTILVYSGNHKIQESFCSHFLETREESFFISLHKRLEHATASDNERRVLLEQFKFKHDEQDLLINTYTIYAVQYGFSRASQKSFAASRAKRLSSVEEDPLVGISPKETLIKNTEEFEMSEIRRGMRKSPISRHPWRKFVRTLDIQHLTVPEYKPGVRTALSEIKRQKDEERKQKDEEKGQQDEEKKKPAVHMHTQLESLQFRDTSYIEITLRFLGCLCDGQNRIMQNYFREQRDNIKTINLVSETCIFLQSFYVKVTKENIDLITEVLLTLIEMCVGNYANQVVIYNHQIIDIINRIIQTTVIRNCTLSKVLKLKAAAVDVLEMMLEETHPKSQDLAVSVHKTVDIEALHSTLAYFYYLRQDGTIKTLGLDDNAERAAFTTYHILVHMADFPNISLDQMKPEKPTDSKDVTKQKRYSEITEAWSFCEKQSKCIEVLYKDNEGQTTLAKVHFRVQDKLSGEIKEKVKVHVNRESPEDKIRDFTKWMDSVKREVKHLNYLRAHWYTHIFVRHIRWRNHAVFLWTLLMNVLLVIAWNTGSPERRSNGMEIAVPSVPQQEDNQWFFSYVLYIGGGIHLLMSLVMTISYFLINGSNFVMPRVFNQILNREITPSYSDQNFFGLKTMYYIVFVLCSAVSLYFYGYFYCICLFHIVVDNDILQRVLRSVTKNGSSLLWVAALGLIVIYVYAVGTFAFMPNDFDDNDGDVALFCGTLFECFVTVLDYGLLDTIGLTISLPANIKDATLRTIFYDLTFFIIVTTIGLNIVFGIIVDTFSELRDERYHIEQDKKGFCFICNIANFDFERRAKGFDHHVKKEHSMWNYIYYSLYLDKIDISDHTAIESYVYTQIKDGDTDYFPLFKARSLQEKEDDTLNELAELKRLMTIIVEHHQEEQRNAVIRKNREDHAEWKRRHLEQTDEVSVI